MKQENNKPYALVCINPKRNTWRVRYDFKKDEFGWHFQEKDFNSRPSVEEIKTLIIQHYNTLCDEEIISGFRFENVPLSLSAENQFNYKAAFDLAVQTAGKNLPVTFKFGTATEPIYRKFSTLDDLKSFFAAAMDYINKTLLKYWRLKDSINWKDYEIEE